MDERYSLWDAFLDLWPSDRVRKMKLGEYVVGSGDKHAFCNQLEAGTYKLGSIWGGSSFKFGVYRLKHEFKAGRKGYASDGVYAWATKYGATAEEAFATVKQSILEVIEAVKEGPAGAAIINNVDLSHMVKWKVAFLYQNREKPWLVPVFKTEAIAAYLQADSRGNHGELVKILHEKEGDGDVFAVADRIWDQWQKCHGRDKNGNNERDREQEKPMSRSHPKNQILFGPPGTGKTYLTRKEAVEICNGEAPEERKELNERYRELYDQGRIRFVTFHQSFSYEDFVEGIRPVMEPETGAGVQYRVEDGIFKRICAAASRSMQKPISLSTRKELRQRKYFKMSIGGQQDPDIEEYCLEQGLLALGWGGDIDYSSLESFPGDYRSGFKVIRDAMEANGYQPRSKFEWQAIWYFKDYMDVGDIVIVGDGLHRIKAIGEVTGRYRYDDNPELREYHHVRAVNWLAKNLDMDARELVGKQLSQQTIYSVESHRINFDLLEQLIAPPASGDTPPAYVLIIDEINRANISKVFGELITLIEDDKRLGADEEIRVRLPYSRKDFSVPPNLYIIGTMNTADRSIAMLDTALRRRFVFKEIMPNPCLLHVDAKMLVETVNCEIKVWEDMTNWSMSNEKENWEWDKDHEGEDLLIGPNNSNKVNLRRLLYAINSCIEALYDRDHTIGHAYLMGVDDLDTLADCFEHKVIPLLQEYFFDDWEKIRRVLGDDRKSEHLQFVQEVRVNGDGPCYRLNPGALKDPDAYIRIYDGQTSGANKK